MASESASGGTADPASRITLRIFSTHESADIAAANLEAHGIPAWVTADDCGGMYPNLTAPGGVRLSVRATDAEAAEGLLNAPVSPEESEQLEREAMAAGPPEPARLNKLVWGQILFGVVIGVLLCLLFQQAGKLGRTVHHHYTRSGQADRCWEYLNGRLVVLSEDRNLDGAWDHWVYYDGRGQISRSEYDNNFDGKTDETWTFSNGVLVSMQKDTDLNGTPDMFCNYKNEIIQEADYRPNGSKFTTTREFFQNGVLTEIWRGGDSHGHFNEVVRYDPFFNPISTNNPAPFELLSPHSK